MLGLGLRRQLQGGINNKTIRKGRLIILEKQIFLYLKKLSKKSCSIHTSLFIYQGSMV